MISVCIATYNGEKYLRRQIDSVLNQLGDEDELVISDDSSTDGTVDIVRAYQDKRIKLHDGQEFHSPIFNFENAIKHAKGDIIVLADQDDKWLPGRVEKAVKLHNEGCNLVVCNRKNVYKDHIGVHHTDNPIKNTWETLKASPFIGCMMSMDRRVLELAIPFPKEIAMHDLWIGLLAQRNLKCGYIDEPLVEYNRHEESYIAKHHFSLYRKLKYRWEIYWLVRKREKELKL
jgi:glycosyltransferase involved in cell wall biosynthesis